MGIATTYEIRSKFEEEPIKKLCPAFAHLGKKAELYSNNKHVLNTELMKAKPNNFPAEEEEKTFQYRSYGKGELASLYLPNITQQSAVERFNEWIDAAPGLKERLLATGMNPRSRRYTPAQVRLIVEVLEEP